MRCGGSTVSYLLPEAKDPTLFGRLRSDVGDGSLGTTVVFTQLNSFIQLAHGDIKVLN